MNEFTYAYLLFVLNFAVLIDRVPCTFSLIPYLIFLLTLCYFVLIIYLALGASIFGI